MAGQLSGGQDYSNPKVLGPLVRYWGSSELCSPQEETLARQILSYVQHTYFVDTQPPLGKLICTTVALLYGFRPDYNDIHQATYASLRLISLVFKSLSPIVAFYILKSLKVSWLSALATIVTATLSATDFSSNTSLVMSVETLSDSSSFLSLLSWFHFRSLRNRYNRAPEFEEKAYDIHLTILVVRLASSGGCG